MRFVLASLLVAFAATAVAQTVAVGPEGPAERISGRGSPEAQLSGPRFSVLSGLRFAPGAQPVCALGAEFRGSHGVTLRVMDACDAVVPDLATQIAVAEGRAVTEVGVCTGKTGQVEGVALASLPDFCLADPALWVERETGAPFRLTVQTEAGLLEPPRDYARPCRWSVHQETLTDARPACRRWMPRSTCPSGQAVTGLRLATALDAQGETVVTGLQALCQPLRTAD